MQKGPSNCALERAIRLVAAEPTARLKSLTQPTSASSNGSPDSGSACR